MAGIEVKVTDRVTIQFPVPCDAQQTAELSRRLESYVSEGYVIVSAQDIETGQRDPYVIGFKITLERK